MHWIYPLYKLSTCWVFVEVLLSGVFKWPQQWLNMLSISKISQRLMLNHRWEFFRYARHCACVGSTCWALLCKCTRLCWVTHGWPRNKGNVEPCWANSNLTQQDSTPLSFSQQGVQLRSTCWAHFVEILYRGQIQCICTLLKKFPLQQLYFFIARIIFH